MMGVSFGIALTLVIFAGAELFTGNNMVGAIGGLFVGGLYWLASPYTVDRTEARDLPRAVPAPAIRSL